MYYAVKIGRNPGIYDNWNDCKENVNGFKGAKFHKFTTYEEAEKFINENEYSGNLYSENNNNRDSNISNKIQYPCAFVDGSYNIKSKVCGFGVAFKLSENDKIQEFKSICLDENLYSMRNVYGEIQACMEAISYAIYLGLEEINIYYDYYGIEMWANKQWNTKINFIKDYINFVDNCRKGNIRMNAIKNQTGKMIINFHKVEAHTGVELNELADKLAKEAVTMIR